MNWILDSAVDFWANQTMPDLGIAPTPQYKGRHINLASWAGRGWLSSPVPHLPTPTGVSSPANIIWCFKHKHWLAGVSLTTSWGTMWRRKTDIIESGLPVVDATVSAAEALISASHSVPGNWTIDGAWSLLTTGKLHWSSVMTSKTLHFMTRALGVVDDCPVPMDNAITRKKLWPSFEDRVVFLRKNHGIHGPILPSISRDRCFDDYNRYMTAILIWRNRKNAEGGSHHWTTTDVEATIFQMSSIHWI